MNRSPNCGGKLKIIAAIPERTVIERIPTYPGLRATVVGYGNAGKITVLDQGINTMITGYSPVEGGVGKNVRDALIEAMPMRFW
jgi:hypothetical protein